MEYGHWNTELVGEFEPDSFFGFTYLIENLDNKRQYIGRKRFRLMTRKKVKGRTNRKVCYSSSKWEEYTGSNEALNQDIEFQGKERFKFTILKLCKKAGELNYAELEEQVKRGVLLSDRFYNDLIRARIHSKHVRNGQIPQT